MKELLRNIERSWWRGLVPGLLAGIIALFLYMITSILKVPDVHGHNTLSEHIIRSIDQVSVFGLPVTALMLKFRIEIPGVVYASALLVITLMQFAIIGIVLDSILKRTRIMNYKLRGGVAGLIFGGMVLLAGIIFVFLGAAGPYNTGFGERATGILHVVATMATPTINILNVADFSVSILLLSFFIQLGLIGLVCDSLIKCIYNLVVKEF